MLDASVIVKWFHAVGEPDLEAARSLRREYERGELLVSAPPLLPLELLNVALRRLRFNREELIIEARELASLRFRFQQPNLEKVAAWASAGLTAYDASYVALADELGLIVVTTDNQILRVAGARAISIADAASS